MTVNGLANRLSALSTFLDFASHFDSIRVRVIWPPQPGVCEVSPEELFEEGFVGRYFLQPSRQKLEVLHSHIKIGLHYNTQLSGWTLKGGWGEEYPFVEKFRDRIRQTNRDGWIIAGGPITATPNRQRGTDYWEARRSNYRRIPFHPYLLSPDFLKVNGPVFPVALHIRKGSHGSQYPSQKATSKIIQRVLKPNPDSPVLIVADSKDTLQQWGDFLIRRGIKVIYPSSRITDPLGVEVPQAIIDFFLLARSKTILSVFWSTFGQEAAHIGEIKSELVELRRWPQSVLYRFVLLLRRIRERMTRLVRGLPGLETPLRDNS